MAKKLIGTLKTNENGEAIFTYQSKKTGKINLFAKTENLESEKFTLYDCESYDEGTINNHNDNMWTNINNITRYNDYSIITSDVTVLSYIPLQNYNCLELDVMTDQSLTTQLGRIAEDSISLLAFGLSNLNLTNNEWHHLKIEIKNNYCTISNDKNNQVVTGNVPNLNKFGLRANAGNNTYFKNVILYNVI